MISLSFSFHLYVSFLSFLLLTHSHFHYYPHLFVHHRGLVNCFFFLRRSILRDVYYVACLSGHAYKRRFI